VPGSSLVHVDLTYHVGSARETVGKSGFAHFFEHMMFEGSKHVANNLHFKYISEAGGDLNGSTNRDRTNYYQTLPSNQLELALWLESDRMGYLLEAVTVEGFENQRSVIKNEKAQRYENQPYGMLGQVFQEHFYPKGHPYSWTTIGYTEDLDRVGLDDLKAFFRTWYGPNNAVLTIGGGFDEIAAIDLVIKYFSDIPAGPAVPKPVFQPVVIDAHKYVSFQDTVRFPMIQLAWPTVPVFHTHEPALDVLTDILGHGKNSRLYQRLVKEGKAVQVYAHNTCYEGSGELTLGVFAYPEVHLGWVEEVLIDEIAKLAKHGVGREEVARATMKYYAQMLYSLESVSNRVSRLAAYHTFAPYTDYLEKDIARYGQVDAAHVMEAVQAYVKELPYLAVSFVGQGQEKLLPRTDNSVFEREIGKIEVGLPVQVEGRENPSSIDRSLKPLPGPAPTIAIPNPVHKQAANGLTWMLSHNKKSPTVSLVLSFLAGSHADPMGQAGLSGFYARMFKESTRHRRAEEIVGLLERLGSSIQASSTKEHFRISMNALAKHVPETVSLLFELLNRDWFDPEELERNRREHMELLQYQMDEVDVLANRAFYETLYGPQHPLGRSHSGYIPDAKNFTIDSLLAYRKQYLHPTGAYLAVSGDISAPQFESIGKVLLEQWTPDDKQGKDLPDPPKPTKGIYVVHKEGAPQSEIRLGYPAMPYSATGDYFHATILNFPLGAAFNSRINLNLREDKGYTYGARSYFHGGPFQGPFVVSAAVATAVTAQAVRECIKEISQFAQGGMTHEELEFTKQSYLNKEALRYETNGQVNGFLLRMMEFDLPLDYVGVQHKMLHGMGLDEINTQAHKFFPIHDMVVVVAGDAQAIVPGLEKLGHGGVIVRNIDKINA
jgi:zinc protease